MCVFVCACLSVRVCVRVFVRESACVCEHDIWFLRMSPRVSGWSTERELLSANGSFVEIDPRIYTLFCACVGVI